MTPADALLRLALIPGLGPITANALLEQVEDPAELFSWSMDRLRSVNGIGPERARRICDPRGDEVARERAECQAVGVRIVTKGETDYPADLLVLNDAPLAIWIQGEIQPRDRLAVALVGPRRPTAYGHRQAVRFATGLARIGACVVSGLARGIDTAAHQAAIDNDGRTIAVLGSGIGKLYPEENAALAQRIAAGNGAVISEFPLHTSPSPGTFPRRNRLVAALSLATLVVEAGATSGALITARLAGELGRMVLAIPGAIDNPEAAGVNKLIRDGATLITSLDDVLDELAPLTTLAKGGNHDMASASDMRSSALSGREKQLYLLLDDTPRSVDDFVRMADLPASAASTTLFSLELKRLAKKAPGGFVRAT